MTKQLHGRVSNMMGSNGNRIVNQFIIEYDYKEVFQSYDTTIAVVYNDGRILLDKEALNYSRTTSKYLFIFLDMTRKNIEYSITKGYIKLVNLN